ncbi:MAG: MFS transporter, partial [Tardiphaga sp.]
MQSRTGRASLRQLWRAPCLCMIVVPCDGIVFQMPRIAVKTSKVEAAIRGFDPLLPSGAPHRMSSLPDVQPQRLMTRHAASVFLVLTLGIVTCAAGAPTPLYRIYQEHWGFSPVMVTLVFAVYALSLLVALLTVGALSDYVGRRPVIFAALILNAIAMSLFVAADSVAMLIAARILQ